MAFLVALARPLITSTISGIVSGAARHSVNGAVTAAASAAHAPFDKEFREKWTPGQLAVVGPQHPGKNILIVCTKHDASKLQGVEHSVLECVCPSSKKTIKYDCYAFDSGDFELQGDG